MYRVQFLRALVARITEIKRDFALCTHLFQVPNLDHRVRSSGTEDETVRVELGAGQSDAVAVLSGVSHAGDQATGSNVGKGPVLRKSKGNFRYKILTIPLLYVNSYRRRT